MAKNSVLTPFDICATVTYQLNMHYPKKMQRFHLVYIRDIIKLYQNVWLYITITYQAVMTAPKADKNKILVYFRQNFVNFITNAEFPNTVYWDFSNEISLDFIYDRSIAT